MDIIVLNSSLQKIAVVDNYTSLMWCKRYYDIGALDLQIEATTQTLEIFKRGNYIMREDDDMICRIEALELETDTESGGNFLIVGAYDIKKILQQRIIWTLKTFQTGTAEEHLRNLITDCIINPTSSPDPALYPAINRKINNFALKPIRNFDTENIIEQITYDNLAEKVVDVCKAYGWGWKVTLENGTFYFDIYRGMNKSENANTAKPVVFSPDFESLSKSKYKVDAGNYKNTALIAGEGEGADRKLRMIGENISGLDRFEFFVDADSMSSNSEEGTMALINYYEAMLSKGRESLAESEITTSFEGDVDVSYYKYKQDYNLGDIITIKNEYGIGSNARIVEVVETWDNEGYTVTPKFDELILNGEVLHAPSINVYDLINGKRVAFTSADRGITFHYTTDGTTPTINSPTGTTVSFYSAGIYTVQVVTERDGILSPVVQRIVAIEKVKPAYFNFPEGFIGGKTFSWTSQTAGAIYRYTLDGTDPNENSFEGSYITYKSVVDVLIKAKAYKYGYEPSEVTQQVATVLKLHAPTITLEKRSGSGFPPYGYKWHVTIEYSGDSEPDDPRFYYIGDNPNGECTNISEVWEWEGLLHATSRDYIRAYCTGKGYVNSDITTVRCPGYVPDEL